MSAYKKPGKLHKDGIWRDLERWSIEWTEIRVFIAPDLRRFSWKKPHHWFHLLTNLPVEAAKIAPWLVGHVVVLQGWAILGLGGYIAWTLLR